MNTTLAIALGGVAIGGVLMTMIQRRSQHRQVMEALARIECNQCLMMRLLKEIAREVDPALLAQVTAALEASVKGVSEALTDKPQPSPKRRS